MHLFIIAGLSAGMAVRVDWSLIWDELFDKYHQNYK